MGRKYVTVFLTDTLMSLCTRAWFKSQLIAEKGYVSYFYTLSVTGVTPS